MANFTGAAEPLTQDGFVAVVEELGVEPGNLFALLTVESKSCGFLADRRPVILFERHKFHRFTNGRHSAANPDISSEKAGGYAFMAKEYPRLEKAAALDRVAALKSASWGAGQIMGFNHEVAGHGDVESMVAAMQESEDAQLMAVAGYLKGNNLATALRKRDWTTVAKAYNGADHAKNRYVERLDGAYRQFLAGTLPDIELRRAQLYFNYLGVPLDVDGVYGKMSRSAVVQFKQANGLAGGERIDKALLVALRDKVAAL